MKRDSEIIWTTTLKIGQMYCIYVGQKAQSKMQVEIVEIDS